MKIRIFSLWVTLIVAVFLFPAEGYGSDTPEAIAAHVGSLTQKVQSSWRDILQYKKNRFPRSGYTSEVTSTTYFLAPNGRQDPLAEMRQTILENFKPVGADPNRHAQCRFPGRHLWLKQHFPGYAGYPDVVCPDFLKWTKNNAVESVSLIFATGYLQNPASYYGHILLKLNYARSIQPSRLLDVTVNYGAIVPPGVNPVSYILNGVFGGYDGGFSHIEYYFHEHNYGDVELRDLWEYELQLDNSDRDLLIAHVWELLGKTYEYYFFDKNCAYQMARLVESTTQIDILPRHYLWVIPQAIFDRISDVTLPDGRKLVKSVKYYPSRQVKLYHKYQQLTHEEKQSVADYVSSTLSTDKSKTARLDQDETSQAKEYETLMEYYDFLKVSDKDLYAASVDKQKLVIVKRLQLPPDLVDWGAVSGKSPDKGSPPARGAISRVYNSQRGAGYILDYRPAYYDEIENSIGKVPNSKLVMLEVEGESFNDHYRVRSLNLLQVESINRSVTGLPGDDGVSWNINVGMKQQNLSCDDCLIPYVRGDYGKFFYPAEHFFWGLTLGAVEQQSHDGSGNQAVIESFSLGTPFADYFKTRLVFENRDYINGIGAASFVKIEGSYQKNRLWDIRFTYTHDKAEEFTLAYGIYW